jgi:hypothetical protein
MPYYKAPDNSPHFLESEEFFNLLPAGCVEINEQEAQILAVEQTKKMLAKFNVEQ